MPRHTRPDDRGATRTRAERRDHTRRVVARRRRALARKIADHGDYQPSFHRTDERAWRHITPAGNIRRVTLADHLAVTREQLDTEPQLADLLGLYLWRAVRQATWRSVRVGRCGCRCSWCYPDPPARSTERQRLRADVDEHVAGAPTP